MQVMFCCSKLHFICNWCFYSKRLFLTEYFTGSKQYFTPTVHMPMLCTSCWESTIPMNTYRTSVWSLAPYPQKLGFPCFRMVKSTQACTKQWHMNKLSAKHYMLRVKHSIKNCFCNKTCKYKLKATLWTTEHSSIQDKH